MITAVYIGSYTTYSLVAVAVPNPTLVYSILKISWYCLHSATVALLALALMLIFRILGWEDILIYKGGWIVLI